MATDGRDALGDTLSVKLLTYPFTEWSPPRAGSAPAPNRNLHGTIRTLDRVGEAVDLTCLQPRDTMMYYAHCEEGLVSRDGYVLVDDSMRPRFAANLSDPAPGKPRAHFDKEWPWVLVSAPRARRPRPRTLLTLAPPALALQAPPQINVDSILSSNRLDVSRARGAARPASRPPSDCF